MNTEAFGGFVLLLTVAVCYFRPTFVATMRSKARGGVIFVNLLLAWTVVGWFVAFIWACSGTTEAEVRWLEELHRELLAAITKDPQVLACKPESEIFG